MGSNSRIAVRTNVRPLAGVFGSLADSTRLAILFLLTEGERDVSSLCKQLRLTQPTVSHHLGLLRMWHLVITRRHGRQVFYSLSPQVRPDAEGKFVVRGGGLELEVSINTDPQSAVSCDSSN